MNTALYAGSFDPWTYGHKSILGIASKLFDKVIVVVAVNPDKKGLLTPEERIEAIERAEDGSGKLTVISSTNELTADVAKRLNANWLVRGVRPADVAAETVIANVNYSIGDIRTIWIPAPVNVQDISSSLVKGLIGVKGWRGVVDNIVPLPSRRLMEEKYALKRLETFTQKVDAFEKLPQTVINAYREPHREYHRLTHIIDCIEHFDEIAPKLNYPWAVELALWFHDSVYDPIGTDNEAKSVSLMKTVSGHFMYSDMAAAMIRMTANHQVAGKLSLEEKQDAEYMLDIDMAILGASDYDSYRRGVMAEYVDAGVPTEYYVKGRLAFLDKVLNQRIFMTDYFFDLLEEKARYNIQREKLWLNSGVIE